MPIASTLSSSTGQITANAAIVPAGTSGAISIFATNPTDIILDINGYFVPLMTSTTQSTALGIGASAIGNQNTAIGFNALLVNSTGNQNTASGSYALAGNTAGNNNVGLGSSALAFNATGSANTAVGSQALLNNLIGNANTAVGYSALWSSTVGIGNTGIGVATLSSNYSGGFNTGVGMSALENNTSGSWNVALGYNAGNQLSTGSYNIEIGNQGFSNDTNTIRLGSLGNQTSTFIAGINTVGISNGSAVLINSNGQLGTVQSSRRYKEDIRDMGDASNDLMRLRPVTFHYKKGPEGGIRSLHYGLIGEEVYEVYPDLVVKGQDGRIESVQYYELPALLINELQKQHRIVNAQEQQIQAAREEIARQRNQIRSFEDRLTALEARH
jgi:hypothetical protein